MKVIYRLPFAVLYLSTNEKAGRFVRSPGCLVKEVLSEELSEGQSDRNF